MICVNYEQTNQKCSMYNASGENGSQIETVSEESILHSILEKFP